MENDNCMGSCPVGITSIRSGRHFVGVEMDSGYFGIALKRLEPYRAIVQAEGLLLIVNV